MMIPFLCTTTRVGTSTVISHSDREGLYVVVMKPSCAIVAAFKTTLFSDESWPDDACDDLKSTHEYVMNLQRRKAKDASVFNEMKALESMAAHNKVPRENVLFVDCTASRYNPDEIAALARDGLDKETEFPRIRANVLWPELNNRVGLALTDVLIDEVWGLTRQEYCGEGI